MNRKLLITGAFVVLVLLSGCNFLGGNQTATTVPTPATDTQTQAPTDGPTMTDSTPTQSTLATGSQTKTPTSVSSDLKAAKLHKNHQAALKEYTSYQYTGTIKVYNKSQVVLEQDIVFKYNRKTGRAYLSTSQNNSKTVEFQTSDRYFIFRQTGENQSEVSFKNIEDEKSRPINPSDSTYGFDFIKNDKFGLINFEETGTTKVAGQQVTVYEAKQKSIHAYFDRFSKFNLTSASLTMYVTDKSLVRKVTYEYEFENGRRVKHEMSLTGLGSTTIDTPSWVRHTPIETRRPGNETSG